MVAPRNHNQGSRGVSDSTRPIGSFPLGCAGADSSAATEGRCPWQSLQLSTGGNPKQSWEPRYEYVHTKQSML